MTDHMHPIEPESAVAAICDRPRHDVIACDLLHSALHECAHLMVAKHLADGDAFVVLWLQEADPMEKKLVVGKCAFSEIADHAMNIMGVAGIVAEDLAYEEPDEWCADDLLAAIEFDLIGSFSESDRAASGEISIELLEECAEFLRAHWGELISAAIEATERFSNLYSEDGDAVTAAASARSELEAFLPR